MSRSLRSGALAAVLALSTAPLLAACGAGGDAQTLQVKPDTVTASVGDISIQNAVIITQPNGSGPASIVARVFNNGNSPQQLTGISVNGLSQSVTVSGAPLTVPAGGTIALGGSGNPTAVLRDTSGLAPDGTYQKVTFSFSSTGNVTVTPLVEPATHDFQGYGAASAISAVSSVTPAGVGASVPASGTSSASPSAPALPGNKPGTSSTKPGSPPSHTH